MTQGNESLRYDEAVIRARLSALPQRGRQLFACACAERLMPAVHWLSGRTGWAGARDAREALDVAWSVARGRPARTGEVEFWLSRLETLTSFEAENSLPTASVVESAVFCISYALRASLTGKLEESVWAARQLYEAADAVVQQGAAAQTYVSDIDREQPVQIVLRGIYSALHDVTQRDPLSLENNADQDGRTFLALLTEEPEVEL